MACALEIMKVKVTNVMHVITLYLSVNIFIQPRKVNLLSKHDHLSKISGRCDDY